MEKAPALLPFLVNRLSEEKRPKSVVHAHIAIAKRAQINPLQLKHEKLWSIFTQRVRSVS
jgi:hypothetical protein